MFRLMGFVFGSAAALVVVLIFTDRPDLEPARAVVQESLSLLGEQLRADAGSNSAADPGPDLTPETPAARERMPIPIEETNVNATSVESNPSPDAPEDPVPVARDQPTPQPQWHVFWSPFRSELSARGFADRVERLTGMDLEVTRVEPGRYQVAFLYLDDMERQSKLAEIAAVTGLQFHRDIP